MSFEYKKYVEKMKKEGKKPKAAKEHTKVKCEGVGKTKQCFKDECDIHTIMERYKRTGVLPMMQSEVQKDYGDFSNVPDYREALQTVINAREAFSSLDAKTRARFGNDPALMLDFCQDEGNYDEMVKMGFIKKKPAVIVEEGVRKSNPQDVNVTPLQGEK